MEFIKNEQYLHECEKLLSKLFNKPTVCMCPGCKNMAINSHVLQNKKILKPIAPKNHLYCFEPNSFFNKEQRFAYKKRGINEVLAFRGYCKNHDDQIFSFIEKTDVDWSDPKSQFLLGYRSICREIYVKQIMVDYYSEHLTKFISPDNMLLDYKVRDYCEKSKLGLSMGIKDMNRYKEFLELGIFNNNYSKYNFETTILPFSIELCVSSPISVSYSLDIPNKDIYEADLPETNIINIFPYKGNTYVIIGFAAGFENRWANALAKILKTQDSNLICKSLNDLILFRSDFNCMSERLFHSILPNNFSEFFKIYEAVGCIKSYSLSTELNIFKDFKITVK